LVILPVQLFYQDLKNPVQLSTKQKETTVLVNRLEIGQTPITLKFKDEDMVTFQRKGLKVGSLLWTVSSTQ